MSKHSWGGETLLRGYPSLTRPATTRRASLTSQRTFQNPCASRSTCRRVYPRSKWTIVPHQPAWRPLYKALQLSELGSQNSSPCVANPMIRISPTSRAQPRPHTRYVSLWLIAEHSSPEETFRRIIESKLRVTSFGGSAAVALNVHTLSRHHRVSLHSPE